MILLTGRDTKLPALVDEHEITSVDAMKEKSRPFSRIYLRNDKFQHSYFLDVLENPEEINKRIRYEKLELGKYANGYPE